MTKITYGLSNIHYAIIETGDDGAITYAKPVKMLGAKEMSLDPTGENQKIYADDMVYVTVGANAGYEGDFTTLALPESFCIDVLGMRKDDNGVLVESNGDVQKQFALLGEFKTESAVKKRFVLYNCTAGKTTFGGKTTEEEVEPQEFAVPITATSAMDTDAVKSVATNEAATKAQFDKWFDEVYIPAFTEKTA